MNVQLVSCPTQGRCGVIMHQVGSAAYAACFAEAQQSAQNNTAAPTASMSVPVVEEESSDRFDEVAIANLKGLGADAFSFEHHADQGDFLEEDEIDLWLSGQSRKVEEIYDNANWYYLDDWTDENASDIWDAVKDIDDERDFDDVKDEDGNLYDLLVDAVHDYANNTIAQSVAAQTSHRVHELTLPAFFEDKWTEDAMSEAYAPVNGMSVEDEGYVQKLMECTRTLVDNVISDRFTVTDPEKAAQTREKIQELIDGVYRESGEPMTVSGLHLVWRETLDLDKLSAEDQAKELEVSDPILLLDFESRAVDISDFMTLDGFAIRFTIDSANGGAGHVQLLSTSQAQSVDLYFGGVARSQTVKVR